MGLSHVGHTFTRASTKACSMLQQAAMPQHRTFGTVGGALKRAAAHCDLDGVVWLTGVGTPPPLTKHLFSDAHC